MTEYRQSQVAAGDGRTLVGVAVRYGDTTNDRRMGAVDRILPGSLTVFDDLRLTVHHDRNRPLAVLGKGLTIEDTADALMMRAEIPDTTEGRDTLTLVRNGVLGGLSVELSEVEFSIADGVRLIEKAVLSAISVVDIPAFAQSKVAVYRRGMAGVLRGVVPAGRMLSCRCQKGDCDSVTFGPEAFDLSPAAQEALVKRNEDILAVFSDYSQPLGSLRRGNLRLARTDDGSMTVEIDLDAAAADRVKESMSAAPVFVRPFMDAEKSQYVQEGTTAVYDHVALRAVVVGSTDVGGDLPEVTIEDRPVKRRRMLLW